MHNSHTIILVYKPSYVTYLFNARSDKNCIEKVDLRRWAEHIYIYIYIYIYIHQLNNQANALANRHANTYHLEHYLKPAICIRGFFDGSVHGKRAAFGWIVLGSTCGDSDMSSWQIVAHKSGCLPDGAAITAAELEGSSSLVSFLHTYYQSYQKALDNISTYASMNHDIIQSLALADLV